MIEFKKIYVYTRKQAVEDGVLVDISEIASEAGFKWPVACTAEVWAAVEDIPPSQSHQDVKGRLWDLVWMASQATRGTIGRAVSPIETHFSLIMHHGRKKYLDVKLITGPGDDGEPVATLVLPNQD